MHARLYLSTVRVASRCVNSLIGHNVAVCIVHVSSLAAMVTVRNCVWEVKLLLTLSLFEI